MIRVSKEVQDRLLEEARWMTSPSERNRWRFGTWVDIVVYHNRGYGSIGVPAWFLPWNRPPRRKYDAS